MSVSDQFSRQKGQHVQELSGKMFASRKGWENSFLCEGASETHRIGQGINGDVFVGWHILEEV